MKRIFSLLLIFIYLVSVTGVTLHAHYCGGTLKSVGLSEKEERRCCGNKKKSKNCCQDKSLKISVEKEQNLANTMHAFLLYAQALPVTQQVFNSAPPVFFSDPTQIIPEVYPPPEITKHRLHLLYGVFLI